MLTSGGRFPADVFVFSAEALFFSLSRPPDADRDAPRLEEGLRRLSETFSGASGWRTNLDFRPDDASLSADAPRRERDALPPADAPGVVFPERDALAGSDPRRASTAWRAAPPPSELRPIPWDARRFFHSSSCLRLSHTASGPFGSGARNDIAAVVDARQRLRAPRPRNGQKKTRLERARLVPLAGKPRNRPSEIPRFPKTNARKESHFFKSRAISSHVVFTFFAPPGGFTFHRVTDRFAFAAYLAAKTAISATRAVCLAIVTASHSPGAHSHLPSCAAHAIALQPPSARSSAPLAAAISHAPYPAFTAASLATRTRA
jgi:hypothetical protein